LPGGTDEKTKLPSSAICALKTPAAACGSESAPRETTSAGRVATQNQISDATARARGEVNDAACHILSGENHVCNGCRRARNDLNCRGSRDLDHSRVIPQQIAAADQNVVAARRNIFQTIPPHTVRWSEAFKQAVGNRLVGRSNRDTNSLQRKTFFRANYTRDDAGLRLETCRSLCESDKSSRKLVMKWFVAKH
jgi:hypothetical protein